MLGGKFLARAPDLLCPGWGFHTSASTIVSYMKPALVACLAFGALLALLLSIFFAIDIYHRRRVGESDKWTLKPFRSLDFDEQDVLRALQAADVIGVGGSGKVYRVRLGGHKDRQYRSVVVKELKKDKEDFFRSGKESYQTGPKENQQHKNLDMQFDAEVKILGSIRHRNIINMLCFIADICTNLLVYEYMENGSLDQWLHKPRGRLDWPSRVGIATDAARGLSYMHDQGIIHRDVKSSNILLNRDFSAKVGDFGLALVLSKPGELEPVSAVCGTPGHIAPEYLRDAEVSEKVDVYSFGVVLLELITGQKPHNAGMEPGIGLAKWASQQYMDKVRWEHIIDKDIQNPAFLEDTKAVFKLGLSCTSENPLDRPTMNEVLQQLLSCDPSKVKHRGKKRTVDAKVYKIRDMDAKVYKIRDKIFGRG